MTTYIKSTFIPMSSIFMKKRLLWKNFNNPFYHETPSRASQSLFLRIKENQHFGGKETQKNVPIISKYLCQLPGYLRK